MKQIVISVDVETEAPIESVESIIKAHVNGHRFFDRLSLPVETATSMPMKIVSVDVRVFPKGNGA